MLKSQTRWFAALLLVQPLSAEIVLAPPFQDGAVLQRDKPIPVWGKATPGKPVSVSFAGQTQSATADANGRWKINFSPLAASLENRVMTVTETGLPPVEVKDVLVGEVWLASGQSNMEWTVNKTVAEDQAIAAKGPVPLLRLFQVKKAVSGQRQDSLTGKWEMATPETALSFSAIGYFFGKLISEELNVPVGVIDSSWGGSRIEPWLAEEGFPGVEELADVAARRLASSPGFPEYDVPFRKYVTAVKNWAAETEGTLDSGGIAKEIPAPPPLLKVGSGAETGTYQSMIHPLVPYALRGFLWYQGESNNGEGMLYAAKQKVLIQGWRKQFAAPEGQFLFVQLAPYGYNADRPGSLPQIWWAQQETLKVPHTGMAVTNDITDIKDIHPRKKFEVARRLSLWALADTYGKKDVVKSGPLYTDFKVTDQGIVVSFAHTGTGLTTRDGQPPTLFEIAGIDGNYQPATAQISPDGKMILLTSPAIAKPDRARFAWSQVAEPNLMNREGLPAASFDTHWPIDLSLGRKVSGGKPIVSSHPNTAGWNVGVTDGTWGNAAPVCYATDATPGFPKTVTIDLGKSETLHQLLYGTPNVGATKTIAVSISEDGTNFTEIGRNDFPPKQAFRAVARFNPTKARYVRATFLANHPAQDNYGGDFSFLSELEAYAPN